MGTNAVAIGGGHGLSPALQALRHLDLEPTAVVTVADDGGSTGRLRADLGIIAPGDLRMALLTLARNETLAEVLAHRFERGELEGHAVGNLLLVALQEMHGGDALAGLNAAAGLLHAAGRALPATLVPVHLCARVGGRIVRGQVRVATTDARIERVWLEPEEPPACGPAVEAIRGADLVVLGPGSLYTSVIANLAVPGIRDALTGTQAKVLYVANMWQQQGEAAGMDLGAHLEALLEHAPGLRIHDIIVHDGPLPEAASPVAGEVCDGVDAGVSCSDLVARDEAGRPAWRHDPQRLAAAIAPFLS